MEDFFKHVVENITSAVLLNFILVPLIMMTAAGAIVRGAFDGLKRRREIIAFSVGSFVLFAALVYAVGSRPQTPQLSGTIQGVVAGNVPGGGERDTVAVITANVVNTGTMQTIIKNWRVTARSNGREYQATFPVMPDAVGFNNIPAVSPNQPSAIVYHKSDNLLEKSLTPIQIGSMVTGLLFVAFQNVDSSVFKAGVDYKVTYEDVFSRQYSLEISTSGTIGTIGIAPGIKAELSCPLPPGGLPKLGNDITSSAKPVVSDQVTKPATSP
jgi:hypothetical protein